MVIRKCITSVSLKNININYLLTGLFSYLLVCHHGLMYTYMLQVEGSPDEEYHGVCIYYVQYKYNVGGTAELKNPNLHLMPLQGSAMPPINCSTLLFFFFFPTLLFLSSRGITG